MVHAFTDLKWDAWQAEKRICCVEQCLALGKGCTGNTNHPQALDARLYSAVGAAGELFAVRRNLFEEMQTDTLLDDFTLSAFITAQGFNSPIAPFIHCRKAARQICARKKSARCACCRWLAVYLATARPLLNPFRYGSISVSSIFPTGCADAQPVSINLLLPLNTILIFTTSTPLLLICILLNIMLHLSLTIEVLSTSASI